MRAGNNKGCKVMECDKGAMKYSRLISSRSNVPNSHSSYNPFLVTPNKKSSFRLLPVQNVYIIYENEYLPICKHMYVLIY